MTLPGLEAALAGLARRGATVTYGTLARQLGLEGPGRIARLTDALESLMEADAAAGAALRAALVTGRVSGGLPARGFFHKAQALGLHDGSESGASAERFHRCQLEQLFVQR